MVATNYSKFNFNQLGQKIIGIQGNLKLNISIVEYLFRIFYIQIQESLLKDHAFVNLFFLRSV